MSEAQGIDSLRAQEHKRLLNNNDIEMVKTPNSWRDSVPTSNPQRAGIE